MATSVVEFAAVTITTWCAPPTLASCCTSNGVGFGAGFGVGAAVLGGTCAGLGVGPRVGVRLRLAVALMAGVDVDAVGLGELTIGAGDEIIAGDDTSAGDAAGLDTAGDDVTPTAAGVF